MLKKGRVHECRGKLENSKSEKRLEYVIQCKLHGLSMKGQIIGKFSVNFFNEKIYKSECERKYSKGYMGLNITDNDSYMIYVNEKDL